MSLSAQLRNRLHQGHARPLSINHQDGRIKEPIRYAPAAVLIAVTDRPVPGVILTRRASHLRKHAGQVAFPGGRMDPEDKDAIATALREAEEEIALPPAMVDIIGVSDNYQTFTGFDIMPVLGVVPPDLPLRVHEAEVESLFEVPLDFLFSPGNRIEKEVQIADARHHYYEIMWEDFRIWGITAAIIANLSKRLGYDNDAFA
ncbi:MAG: CoA pyrophosphatase [Sphingobium sp.]